MALLFDVKLSNLRSPEIGPDENRTAFWDRNKASGTGNISLRALRNAVLEAFLGYSRAYLASTISWCQPIRSELRLLLFPK